tara:strand:+ start:2165 stop:2617 length:453 start_codon:yes stop_codon:yes gene_type:complete
LVSIRPSNKDIIKKEFSHIIDEKTLDLLLQKHCTILFKTNGSLAVMFKEKVSKCDIEEQYIKKVENLVKDLKVPEWKDFICTQTGFYLFHNKKDCIKKFEKEETSPNTFIINVLEGEFQGETFKILKREDQLFVTNGSQPVDYLPFKYLV